jgi:Bacterial Ig-like domain (group 3)/FG-GAP-like repeat
MRIHTQLRSLMTCEPAPRSQALSGVARFMLALTILIALVALAPLQGLGQSARQSPLNGNRLQAKGSVSGVSQPSSPLFRPAATYESGASGATSVTAADVNGDGKPDLLLGNLCSSSINCNDGSVGVLLGNGDGTFKPALTYISGGFGVESIAVADLNGDGHLDLVVTNCAKTGSGNCPASDGTLGILLGNGDGSFQPAVTYSTGGIGSWSVAVADVNGDGKPDLIVVGYSSSPAVGVLLGNGDGTFQPARSYGLSGGSAVSVVASDVNGDRKPDLIVTILGGTVDVLLGEGDGTFPTVTAYGSGGFSTWSVAVADVNSDNKPDLLVANGCIGNCVSGAVGVLLGNGDGTFQPAMTYGSGGNSTSIAVADLDGDGKADVVLANECGSCNQGLVSILLGNRDGTFQSALTFGSGGQAALSVAIADVNGDDKPDLLVANLCKALTHNCPGDGSAGVLINNLHRPTSTLLTSSLTPSTYGQKVTWTATVTSSGSITPTGKVQFKWSIYSIGTATLDSSGVATLTSSNLNADSYPLTAVYLGDAADLGSTSAVLNQVVMESTSTATLTSSPNPSTHGQAVSFTAKISSPTVIPTGPVTFSAGTTVLGTTQLSGGKATLTISSLAVGLTKVTATYHGNSNIAKCSASVTQTVH